MIVYRLQYIGTDRFWSSWDHGHTYFPFPKYAISLWHGDHGKFDDWKDTLVMKKYELVEEKNNGRTK